MSRPMADTTEATAPRRQFTDEFKARPSAWCSTTARRVGAAARDLDLTETALARVGASAPGRIGRKGRTGLTTAEREELARLRKENRELRTERDILKKAAAFFAKHQRKVRLDRRGEGRVPVAACCVGACGVSPSGFYAWQQRPAVGAARRDRQLRVLIRASLDGERAPLRPSARAGRTCTSRRARQPRSASTG